ncbi:nuclear transport factor 2 family protein [Haladaptatus sp. AB643]|uniref:nuclear transport factor 2 family protein n=1 Tax=Haladaptatus sp. AB643 TaxID=2934174 RepID=UPI00209BF810|nr:nuclear transport factor 2 family protein [Haladaptatus sp. AB643]MCO8245470.1 nuclear transport factor 2 family protein [Haladaptatus sp. AB643]
MARAEAKSNVELVERVYDAFNEGDIDTPMATMAEDIEWIEPEGDIYGGTYHGPEEVLENVFTPCLEDFEEFEVDTDEFIDGGDTIVVLGTFRGMHRTSGKPLAVPFAHVWELEDGRMTRFIDYLDTVLWRETYET